MSVGRQGVCWRECVTSGGWGAGWDSPGSRHHKWILKRGFEFLTWLRRQVLELKARCSLGSESGLGNSIQHLSIKLPHPWAMSVSICAFYFVDLLARCVLMELLLHVTPFWPTKGFVGTLYFEIVGKTCNQFFELLFQKILSYSWDYR